MPKPNVGIEPTTDALQKHCSSAELNWRRRSERETNQSKPLFLDSNMVPVQTNHDQKPGPTGYTGYDPVISRVTGEDVNRYTNTPKVGPKSRSP